METLQMEILTPPVMEPVKEKFSVIQTPRIVSPYRRLSPVLPIL